MMSEMNGFRREIGQTKCKIYFPGFSYDDFDRNGCLSSWKISKLFEGGNFMGYLNGFLQDLIPLTETTGSVILAYQIQLNPTPFRLKTFPFSISIELKALGSSSFVIRHELRNEVDQTLIGTYDVKQIYFNRTTRTPKMISKSVRERYAALIDNIEPIQIAFPGSIPDVPLDSFHIPISILPSDTDFHQHLNQGYSLRYCLDCASVASSKGKYDYFVHDICNYQAVDVVRLFRGEGLAGDLVHVHTWQEKHKPLELHFVITKDKNPLVYTKITFAQEPIPQFMYTEFVKSHL